uniref:WD_REPEATS_REGION domain-containing protein n=1 Tax=Angiostrongylus cantonensis TaxID=6313 RepID=A0A0K0CZC3_ANGCA
LLSSTLKKIIYVEENFSALVEPRGGMPYLFASGGRDRLVHLFRPGKTSYEHCNVIEDHQSALNTVRFVQKSDELYLFTCGSDKTIIIWRLVLFTHFNRENQISSQMGINDLLIPMSGNVLLTSCQDRQLRAYSLSGKLLTTVRGTGGEADLQQGSLGKFCLDPSGIYAASVCSDRHVYMVEVRSGKCLAALTGIGESATDVEYSEDCRRLYITASNGCIFVWRLSDTLVNRMQIAKASLQTLVPRPESPDSLLGSESEVVSEELQIDNSDSSSPQFGSRESLDNWCLNETVTIREGEDSRNERALRSQIVVTDVFFKVRIESDLQQKRKETKSESIEFMWSSSGAPCCTASLSEGDG